jgi:histidine triad (HIT) family protein
MASTDRCVFDRIRDVEVPAHLVLDEADLLGFLDARPVFPGHTLVIPRAHVPTLADLPLELCGPLFDAARRVAGAMRRALGSDGAFVALNDEVSQSVPHVHIHVVPRKRKDGLRGFFWPRHRYADDDEAAAIAERIRAALGPSGPAPERQERAGMGPSGPAPERQERAGMGPSGPAPGRQERAGMGPSGPAPGRQERAGMGPSGPAPERQERAGMGPSGPAPGRQERAGMGPSGPAPGRQERADIGQAPSEPTDDVV